MKRGKRTSVAKATKAAKATEDIPETIKIPMAVHITGLQRPFAEQDLKEKLISFTSSEITDFRVNSNKSECVATIADTEGAELIRAGLHEKPWYDKPDAKPVSVELVAPNFEFLVPVVPETPAMVLSSTETPGNPIEETKSTAMDTDGTDKTEPPGTLYTKTLPSLSFRPRSEEQVLHMKKRRNYDLDSTTLTGRFYSEKKRKRNHTQMEASSPTPSNAAPSSTPSSAAPSANTSSHRDHHRDHPQSRRNDRYDRGGDRYDRSGSYGRRDSRYDHYERRDSHHRSEYRN